jgi:DNA-binding transcriptional MerR regulator
LKGRHLYHAIYPMVSNVQTSDGAKKYYAIGEVAQLLNVSTSLIRFWEKSFPSLHPHKNQQGLRRYTQADILRLRKIYQLVKKQGYTLQGAREVIKRDSKKPQSNAEIVHTLKTLREFLVYLKDMTTDT